MTNPDISTLNGSLEQLGITMAANLVAMGVTDATASQGLTTLAGRILEISPVTPTLAISLTADKSVLSYYDSESATLSATVTENGSPKESATVEFFKGSTSLGTATTNSSGVATKTYASTGAGDVSFTAECGSLVSETYSIQDCLLYDVDGFSKTTTTTTDTSYATGYNYSLAATNSFQLEFDYNNPTGFRLYFGGTQVVNTGDNVTYCVGFTRDGSGKLTFTERTTTTSNTTCQSISSGTNHYKVTFNGNVVNVWVNDVQQVNNKTLSWWNTHAPYYFNWAIWAKGTGTVSNIKIKAL